jgi:hypothetical protein
MDHRIDLGSAPVWLLSRSRPIIEMSRPIAGQFAGKRRA